MSTNSTKQKLLTLVDEFDIITRFSNRPHITTVYIIFSWKIIAHDHVLVGVFIRRVYSLLSINN